MTRFIVIHRLPDGVTQENVFAVGKAALARLSGDVRWLRSWVLPEDNRILCEWEAPSSETIRATLEGLDLFPIEGIHAAEFVDPAWFAE